MPCSSSIFTSVASVKRGGGSVKCCFGSSFKRSSNSLFGEWRKRLFLHLIFGILVVSPFCVNSYKTIKLDYRACRPESIRVATSLPVLATDYRQPLARTHVNRRLVEYGVRHLRSEESLPDEAVHLILVVGEVLLDALRVAS